MTRHTVAFATAVFVLLAPVRADVTATILLGQGVTLDLDTGAIGTAGASDLVYTGPNGMLAPVAIGTMLAIWNDTGSAAFNRLTQENLYPFFSYSSVPLQDTQLQAGLIIVAKTKAGKYSKILIASRSVGAIAVIFNTFTSPYIDDVRNNYGRIPAGLPNSGLAPGALFFIKGATLSAVNDGQTLRSSAAPGLQNTIGGVSVTVSVNGTSFTCPLYYLSPTQINAVLPGGAPLGNGSIVVTNNQDKSVAFATTVSQSSFGIVNYNGSFAATYDANNALITSFNAANPGQTIVIWGSGVGGDPANDDRLFPQKTNNLVNLPLQVLVGGRPAAILYSGRSQFPGVDQIVVTLPADVPTGCYVSLSVIPGTILSNGVTIPVAASGKTCADPGDPLTPTILQTLSAKKTARIGSLYVYRSVDVTSGSTTVDVSGEFRSGSAALLTDTIGSLSLGNCITTSPSPSITSGPLDAGQTINVTSLRGTLILNKKVFSSATTYGANVPTSFVTVEGGEFAFFNPAPGTDVQQFSTVVSVPSNFTWTNSSALATIDRRGATFSWSGGSNAAYVVITGVADVTSGYSASFRCNAPVRAGQFTVPQSVLLAMPPGPGKLYLEAVSSQQSFTAPGLDWGLLDGRAGFTRSTRF